MKSKFLLLLILVLIETAGCRTLNSSAEKVQVIDKIPDSCQELGTVNVDWTWWGLTTESLNGMKNQVAKKGGNTLHVQGDGIGTAYKCPNSSTRIEGS